MLVSIENTTIQLYTLQQINQLELALTIHIHIFFPISLLVSGKLYNVLTYRLCK
jgi:hypothetical protein